MHGKHCACKAKHGWVKGLHCSHSARKTAASVHVTPFACLNADRCAVSFNGNTNLPVRFEPKPFCHDAVFVLEWENVNVQMIACGVPCRPHGMRLKTWHAIKNMPDKESAGKVLHMLDNRISTILNMLDNRIKHHFFPNACCSVWFVCACYLVWYGMAYHGMVEVCGGLLAV